VLAKTFARIHRQNLINYGVLPLVFAEPEDYDRLGKDDVIVVRDLRRALEGGKDITLECKGSISTKHDLTATQIEARPHRNTDKCDPCRRPHQLAPQ
jgi:aconitate hydratase